MGIKHLYHHSLSRWDTEHQPLYTNDEEYWFGCLVEETVDEPQLFASVQAAAQQILNQNREGQLVIQLHYDQLMTPSWLQQLLDCLLKMRFSWRNVILWVSEEVSIAQSEPYNQMVYWLHNCQLRLWVTSPSVLDDSMSELIVDRMVLDQQQQSRTSDLEVQLLSSLEDQSIPLTLLDPPIEWLSRYKDVHSLDILNSMDIGTSQTRQ